jgi:DNA-binding transcriptional MerR regulator
MVGSGQQFVLVRHSLERRNLVSKYRLRQDIWLIQRSAFFSSRWRAQQAQALSYQPTTISHQLPYGTNWGCSRARILLETAESGILAFLITPAPRLTGRMSPKKKSNGKSGKSSEILIPEKLYFRIGEVARLCRLPAYVLRFWETEFPQLKPVKSSTGQRMYRRRDVESVVRIKQLLYEEGYTIAGARQHLRDEGKNDKKQVALPFMTSSPANLRQIRQGLQEILTIVSSRR